MTKQELKDWIKSAKYDGIAEDEYDSNGNNFRSCVYEKDGKFYLVDYCNREPSEVYGKNGFIRGVYEPKEVIRHTQMIQEVYYEPVKKEGNATN